MSGGALVHSSTHTPLVHAQTGFFAGNKINWYFPDGTLAYIARVDRESESVFINRLEV